MLEQAMRRLLPRRTAVGTVALAGLVNGVVDHLELGPRVGVGLRPALGWSSAALCACVAVLAVYLAVAARRDPAPAEATDAA